MIDVTDVKDVDDDEVKDITCVSSGSIVLMCLIRGDFVAAGAMYCAPTFVGYGVDIVWV